MCPSMGPHANMKWSLNGVSAFILSPGLLRPITMASRAWQGDFMHQRSGKSKVSCTLGWRNDSLPRDTCFGKTWVRMEIERKQGANGALLLLPRSVEQNVTFYTLWQPQSVLSETAECIGSETFLYIFWHADILIMPSELFWDKLYSSREDNPRMHCDEHNDQIN